MHPSPSPAWGFIAAAVLLASTGGPAAAQVEATTRLDASGYGVTRVHNASAEVVDVTMELRLAERHGERLVLGDSVGAVVSPARFHLGPGETQTVRLLLRSDVPAGSDLRLVTTLTPRSARPVETAGGATAQLVLATRLVSMVSRE